MNSLFQSPVRPSASSSPKRVLVSRYKVPTRLRKTIIAPFRTSTTSLKRPMVMVTV